ncbi:hypothetical protein LJB88_03740 [Erysipelotrichaceae bacterium OttesenSCG-928-M19]|nr:hypothetical protein [Erysipelotrichaceae bacterium OttesenSCG-928-M19]
MKKTLVLISFLSLLFISNNVNAAYKNIGSNSTNNAVVHTYDGKTGTLKAYGFNGNGNLGLGNKNDVKKDDIVTLNSKVNNKKIVDYYFNYSNTYLLTDTGEVYASGKFLANELGNTTVFKRIYFYNTKKYKITSFDGRILSNKDTKKLAEMNSYNLTFYTNNKRVIHEYDNWVFPAVTRSYLTNWEDYNECNSYYDGYIHYKYNEKKKETKVVVSKSNKLLYKHVYYIDKKLYTKVYNNSGLKSYCKRTPNKELLIKYKNGKRYKKYINNYKLMKDDLSETEYYARPLVKSTVYKYNNKGKIYERMIYKFKLSYTKKGYLRENGGYRYSKKEYKRNSKKQLKSNKYGKAYAYTTYFKKGKAIKTYKYDYNKKGKMVNKRVVKTRK